MKTLKWIALTLFALAVIAAVGFGSYILWIVKHLPQMFGIPDFLIKPLIGFVAILAAMVGIYFAWNHYVAKPYIEQGRAIERAELLPTIETLKLRLDADIEAFNRINASMLLITRNSENIKQAVAKAASINAARNKTAETRIEYIERIVPVGATECEKTADAVAKVFR